MSAGSNNREFIDFGFSTEWYGAVYFCTICFSEIARALDFVGFKTYETLLSQNQELKEALDKANKRIGSLNATLRDCFNGDNPGDTISDVLDSGEVSQPHSEDNSRTEQSSSADDDSSGIEEFGSVLSTSESNSTSTSANNPLQF
jgi:hypothetical protein